MRGYKKIDAIFDILKRQTAILVGRLLFDELFPFFCGKLFGDLLQSLGITWQAHVILGIQFCLSIIAHLSYLI